MLDAGHESNYSQSNGHKSHSDTCSTRSRGRMYRQSLVDYSPKCQSCDGTGARSSHSNFNARKYGVSRGHAPSHIHRWFRLVPTPQFLPLHNGICLAIRSRGQTCQHIHFAVSGMPVNFAGGMRSGPHAQRYFSLRGSRGQACLGIHFCCLCCACQIRGQDQLSRLDYRSIKNPQK
jgi:hypothetical protein